MGRKTKDVKPTCIKTGNHNFEYVADEYAYTDDGYWEIYRCSKCSKTINVTVAD